MRSLVGEVTSLFFDSILRDYNWIQKIVRYIRNIPTIRIKQPYWNHCQNIDKATDSHLGRTDTHSKAAALRTWCLALRKVATIASMLNHYQNNGQILWTSGNTQQSSHDIILQHNKTTTKHKMLQRMHWQQNWQPSMQSLRPTMLPQIQQTACKLFTFLKLNHMPSPPQENAHKLLCILIELCFLSKIEQNGHLCQTFPRWHHCQTTNKPSNGNPETTKTQQYKFSQLTVYCSNCSFFINGTTCCPPKKEDKN